MIHNKRFLQRLWQPGPGGWKCVCCAPAPGPFRKAMKRATKRAAGKRAIQDEIELGLQELNAKDAQ